MRKFPKPYFYLVISLCALLILISQTILKGAQNENTFAKHLTDILPQLVATILTTTIVFGVIESSLYRRDFLSTSYNVAIIGYPQSGKTTLIVSLFEEIFNRKVYNIKATLKGESTIERINALIEKKQSGISPGPTTDQTMFAYRTMIEVGKGIFRKKYKVEFGDYPGEYSEKLNENEYFDELRKSEYFKWCIEANAYIFVVDVGQYLLSKDKDKFVATTAKAIRQSWQHFLDFNLNENSKKHKPIVLVFNKMDLAAHFDFKENKIFYSSIEDDFLKKIPKTEPLIDSQYTSLRYQLDKDFHDLIAYLSGETNDFHVLFTSSFGTIAGKLADIGKILKFILPRKWKFDLT